MAKNNKEIKSDWYKNQSIANNYEKLRFGSHSGRWVMKSEERVVSQLIAYMNPGSLNVALDIPTGTGRMIPMLLNKFPNVLACDTSIGMLNNARQYGANLYCLADAEQMVFSTESIDFILSSRFMFHFKDLTHLFQEISRILKPGGWLICDTYNWTPRVLIPGNQNKIGGRVFLHRKKEIKKLACQFGLEVKFWQGLFVLTPFIYRFMPLMIVKLIEKVGHILLFGFFWD